MKVRWPGHLENPLPSYGSGRAIICDEKLPIRLGPAIRAVPKGIATTPASTANITGSNRTIVATSIELPFCRLDYS